MLRDSHFIVNSIFGGDMKIVLMEGEQEIWRMQAKKEAYLVFPINILAAILKIFSGIREI